MKLSIITINKNNAHGLAKTIDSIKIQIFTDYEYILIDGDSNDDSKNIISKNKKIINKLVSEKDEGIYSAMNKGIALASGEYIHLLNSGDIYSNSNVLNNIFKNDNLKSICCSVFKEINNKKKIIKPKVLISENFVSVAHPGLILHRSIYAKSQYKTKYKIVADNLFIYQNIKPNIASIYNDILVIMEPGGVSSNFSLKHEIEKFKLLWNEDYRKDKKILLQIKYILDFVYQLRRIF